MSRRGRELVIGEPVDALRGHVALRARLLRVAPDRRGERLQRPCGRDQRRVVEPTGDPQGAGGPLLDLVVLHPQEPVGGELEGERDCLGRAGIVQLVERVLETRAGLGVAAEEALDRRALGRELRAQRVGVRRCDRDALEQLVAAELELAGRSEHARVREQQPRALLCARRRAEQPERCEVPARALAGASIAAASPASRNVVMAARSPWRAARST